MRTPKRTLFKRWIADCLALVEYRQRFSEAVAAEAEAMADTDDENEAADAATQLMRSMRILEHDDGGYY